jgi:Flp pilus assembly protein TadB
VGSDRSGVGVAGLRAAAELKRIQEESKAQQKRAADQSKAQAERLEQARKLGKEEFDKEQKAQAKRDEEELKAELKRLEKQHATQRADANRLKGRMMSSLLVLMLSGVVQTLVQGVYYISVPLLLRAFCRALNRKKLEPTCENLLKFGAGLIGVGLLHRFLGLLPRVLAQLDHPHIVPVFQSRWLHADSAA